jgi:hypothetical protein
LAGVEVCEDAIDVPRNKTIATVVDTTVFFMTRTP